MVEKFTELELLVKYMEELGVRQPIGVRVKLASRGSGPVARSAPATARKFGLTLTEVLEAFEYLKARGLDDCLQMTHFHMGSQVSNIRKVKDALTEAARVYVELYRLGAGLKYIDVGGGLGVDYDGSQTDFESSTNYTLQEYANDVVFRIKRCATRPACRTRRSSPRAAGRWSRTTRCWCSTCSARPTSTSAPRRTRCPTTPRSRSATCSPTTGT